MAYILAGAAVTVAVAGLTLRRIEQVSAPTPAPRRAVDRIAERAAA
jgi:hypothetical protein